MTTSLTHSVPPHHPNITICSQPDAKLLPDVDPFACSTCSLSQGCDLDIPEVGNVVENRCQMTNIDDRVMMMVNVEVSTDEVDLSARNLYII